MFEWLGLKAEKFRFEDVQSVILSVRNLTELNKNEMTVKTAALLSTYRIEESRYDKIKETEKSDA